MWIEDEWVDDEHEDSTCTECGCDLGDVEADGRAIEFDVAGGWFCVSHLHISSDFD